MRRYLRKVCKGEDICDISMSRALVVKSSACVNVFASACIMLCLCVQRERDSFSPSDRHSVGQQSLLNLCPTLSRAERIIKTTCTETVGSMKAIFQRQIMRAVLVPFWQCLTT